MSTRSCSFTHAITRRPATSIVAGLRAVDIGVPDFDKFLLHHSEYVKALKVAGAQVTELPALEEFPDSVFVEDPALCLPEGAVLMRPGAPTRLGESEAIRPYLEALYGKIYSIPEPGFIEGGDILVTNSEILVGTSSRTNQHGIEALREIVSHWGYNLRSVHTPPDVLHFKTDCSLLDEETILSTKRLAESGCFSDYRVIHTQEGEEACANTIRFNDRLIMPSGFPRTQASLEEYGYKVQTICNSEAAKLDGGMSCLSLRFSPDNWG